MLVHFGRRHWVRVLGCLYPFTTFFVVMGTGNHYFIDVVAGLATLLAGCGGDGGFRDMDSAMGGGSGIRWSGPAGADPFAGLGKVAALGIKVSRHCTYHGAALNVAMDLEPFERINPCGYAGLKTVDLSTIGVQVTWDEAARVLGEQLTARL